VTPPALTKKQFLLGCSGQELTEFLLVRHARAANFRKELFDLIDRWVENAAEARLAAEVNAIREELKHGSTLPFQRKEVEQAPPHGETPVAPPELQVAEHRRREFYATRSKRVT
jgi:hypothetical protein